MNLKQKNITVARIRALSLRTSHVREHTSSEPHETIHIHTCVVVVQNKHLIFRDLNLLHYTKKQKKKVVLGIPRIELGTLRSLSVHLTTRLNPQLVLYVYACRNSETKKGAADSDDSETTSAAAGAGPSERWT